MAQQFNAVGLGHRRRQSRRGPYTGNGDHRFWRSPAPEPDSPGPVVVHKRRHRSRRLTGIIIIGSGNDDRVVRPASTGLRRADRLPAVAYAKRRWFVRHAPAPEQPERGKPGLLVVRLRRRRGCGRRWRRRHGHSTGTCPGSREDVRSREGGASGSVTRPRAEAVASQQRWWQQLRIAILGRRQQCCASGSGSAASGCRCTAGRGGRAASGRRGSRSGRPAACCRRRATVQPRRLTSGITNAGTNDDAPARHGYRGSLSNASLLGVASQGLCAFIDISAEPSAVFSYLLPRVARPGRYADRNGD